MKLLSQACYDEDALTTVVPAWTLEITYLLIRVYRKEVIGVSRLGRLKTIPVNVRALHTCLLQVTKARDESPQAPLPIR